jgi:hypothetical protein
VALPRRYPPAIVHSQFGRSASTCAMTIVTISSASDRGILPSVFVSLAKLHESIATLDSLLVQLRLEIEPSAHDLCTRHSPIQTSLSSLTLSPAFSRLLPLSPRVPTVVSSHIVECAAALRPQLSSRCRPDRVNGRKLAQCSKPL